MLLSFVCVIMYLNTNEYDCIWAFQHCISIMHHWTWKINNKNNNNKINFKRFSGHIVEIHGLVSKFYNDCLPQRIQIFLNETQCRDTQTLKHKLASLHSLIKQIWHCCIRLKMMHWWFKCLHYVPKYFLIPV